MKILRYKVESPEETESLGKKLAEMLEPYSFVALFGDLGAGKTAFARGIISHFDNNAVVTSPTYNIVNSYLSNSYSVYHFDMYRISDEDDLYSVGFYDYLDTGIIVSEWSENIPFAIPKNAIKVTIKKLSQDNEREITMEFPL